jgi:formate--tetrahydrofolate ligase
MLSDIEIIKNSKMKKITDVVKSYDIASDELYLFGNYISKVDLSIFKRLEKKPDGKLILVTAITPTPAGEGKSTTTIGLVDALNRIGKKCIGAIREPSLGPVFGVKGGAAGGGYAQVNPMVELNLHFTGDIHAITTANNLVSAIIDNHLYQGNALNIDPNRITWKRCIDLNDRALRKIEVGLSSNKEVKRYDYFNISVASEIMAMLCLATSVSDLRRRLDKTVVAYTYDDKPVTIKDLQITGSLLVLLKDAMRPNLVQTLENNLMIVHGGPFANIAHGCNSILGTKLALKLGDYVVTEAGFGADLGAEKFLDIKCQVAGLKPSLVVVVATIRALKYHGGQNIKNLTEENTKALALGIKNLEKHLETVKAFGLDFVVAVNRFLTDTDEEIKMLMTWAKEKNVEVALSEVYGKGSLGGVELANKVVNKIKDVSYKPLYQRNESIFTKINKIATTCYGAKGVTYNDEAFAMLQKLEQSEYKDFYICMAKTPNSLTDNPKIIGRPEDFTINIKEVRLATGSEFIICLTGDIMTMPGLGKEPLALKIDMNDEWEVFGLM